MDKCSICLKKSKSTVSVLNIDKNSIKWFTKLQYVIPELEWFEEYTMCRSCSKQCDKAWNFKKTVIALEEGRRELLTKTEAHLTAEYNSDDNNSDNKLATFTCYNCKTSFNTKEDLIYHVKELQSQNKLCSVNTQENYNSHPPKEYLNVKKELNDTASLNEYDFHYSLQSEDESKNIKIDEIVEDIHSFPEHKVKQEAQESSVKKRRGRKCLRKFYCEICNKECDYVKELIDHSITVHGTDPKTIKPYPCERCSMRFVSAANLHQHRNYHDKNRNHVCSLCGKTFITKSDLTVHEYTHYNRRNYICTICEKGFNTNKNLRTHELVVHTDRSLWKYLCTICEKRFPLKTNYEQHCKRHSGDKGHHCPICKKAFVDTSELRRHMLTHTNIRAFKCNLCGREYKENRNYLVHMAQKHGIGNAKFTVREKKFVCHICPSQFYDKQKLMRHICSHSGLKPFSCHACEKKFADKSYLKHHLKTVHNIVFNT